MKAARRLSCFLRLSMVLAALVAVGCSSAQVVNNSGVLIKRVKVGHVDFRENLDDCAGGCSTGFKEVKAVANHVSLKETDTSLWKALGYLSTFAAGTNYAVNIRKVADEFCAELWKRNQTDSTFNDDTTKELIDSHCRE